MMADNDENTLHHQSGVNARSEPFVQLIRGGAVIAQMDPGQARDHAIAMLEAAEAAETDAFIHQWVKERVGAGPEQAAGLLMDFRRYRRERTGKQGGPTDREEWTMPPPTK